MNKAFPPQSLVITLDKTFVDGQEALGFVYIVYHRHRTKSFVRQQERACSEGHLVVDIKNGLVLSCEGRTIRQSTAFPAWERG